MYLYYRNYIRRVAVVGAFLLLSGCFRPTFRPEGIDVPSSNAHALCQEINLQRSEVKSLRALADTTVVRGSERFSFRYAVVSEEPSKFRVDVLPPAGGGAYTLGLLVANDGKVLWLDPQEKRYVWGSSERDLIAKYIGLQGISRRVAVALMTGTVPRLSCDRVTMRLLGNNDVLVVDDESKVAWYLAGRTPRLKGAKVLDADGSSCEMEAALLAQDNERPGEIALQIFSPASARVTMTVTRLVINPTLKPELFAVSPPNDYTSAD